MSYVHFTKWNDSERTSRCRWDPMSASGRRTQEMQRLSPTPLSPAGVRPARDRSGLAAHPWRSPLCSHTSYLLAGAQVGAWALESTAPEAVQGLHTPSGQRQVLGSPLWPASPRRHEPGGGFGSALPPTHPGLSYSWACVALAFTQPLGEKCRLVIFIRTLQDYKALLISLPISTLDVICLYHLPSFLLDSFS